MIKGLLIFGAIQGLIFSVAILSIKSPRSVLSNRLFALLILSVSLFVAIGSQGSHFIDYPKFFLASYGLIYLYCPLYCLFAESIGDSAFRLKSKHLLYMLPVLIMAGALVRFMMMDTSEVIQALRTGAYKDLLICDLVSITMNIFLLWKGWRITSNHQGLDHSQNRFSPFSFLSSTLFITNLLWLYVFIARLAPGLNLPKISLDYIYVGMSVLVFVFGYTLVLKAEYFRLPAIVHNIRYRSVKLDMKTLKSVEQKIIEVLETDKPYKNIDFSLTDLSSIVGVDKVKLSYTISNSLNTNFTSLVNQYRVEEFIRLVNSNGFSNYSNLGIAAEAGFKSKSTFYKAFKEIKGSTPKEFFERLELV